MLEAVLFDLDGTLLDTSPDFLIATNILLQRHGHPIIDRETLAPYITNGSAGIIEALFNISRDHSAFQSLWDELLKLYLHHIADETHYYSGMEEVIAYIEQHQLKWGIVTNKPSRYANPLLTGLKSSGVNINPACCICPDHVVQAKPAPDALFLACKQLEINAEKTLYVGDHLRDIVAAKAAGMASIAATYGFIQADEDPAKWGAEHSIDQPIELIAIINQYL